MRVLVDTNVLVRIFQPTSPHSATGSTAITKLLTKGFSLCITPQNLYELWAVATRPVDNNGLGILGDKALLLVEKCIQEFELLQDDQVIFQEWLRLIAAHDIRGKRSHDARLVAAMIRHGVTSILTFNYEDFKNFPIAVLEPLSVIQNPEL